MIKLDNMTEEGEVTTGLKLAMLAFAVVLIGALGYFVLQNDVIINAAYQGSSLDLSTRY